MSSIAGILQKSQKQAYELGMTNGSSFAIQILDELDAVLSSSSREGFIETIKVNSVVEQAREWMKNISQNN